MINRIEGMQQGQGQEQGQMQGQMKGQGPALAPFVRKNFPFQSNFVSLSSGQRIHYVDEGAGSPIVMVHGNPTWSFYYRHLIAGLRNTHRVVALDHLGCGLSDKPQNYAYTLENHIKNLRFVIQKLQLRDITLVVHDWGGAIALGYATLYPENIKGLVILNTAAFTSQEIPWRISMCRIPLLGEWMVRGPNAFARAATRMAVVKKLDGEIKKAYLFPYNNYKNRVALARFVQDIPLGPRHPSYQQLHKIESKLHLLKCPKLILWGGGDFCFHHKFLARWKEIYPEATSIVFPNAGHYLLEDEGPEVLAYIRKFLK